MKTTISLLSGLALGYFISIRIAPKNGRAFRANFFSKDEANDSGSHTFSINELTSPDSVNLNELKKKIKSGL